MHKAVIISNTVTAVRDGLRKKLILSRGLAIAFQKGWIGSCSGRSRLEPEIRKGPGPPKIFSALWASVWSQNKGRGPSPGSTPVFTPALC